MVPQPIPVPYMLDPMGYPIPMMPPMGFPHSPLPPMPMLNMNSVTSPRGIPGEFPYNIPPQFAVVDEPNLFIFHLPPDMDDKGLHDLFAEFGHIESAKVSLFWSIPDKS